MKNDKSIHWVAFLTFMLGAVIFHIIGNNESTWACIICATIWSATS